jgi:hypothetical protein
MRPPVPAGDRSAVRRCRTWLAQSKSARDWWIARAVAAVASPTFSVVLLHFLRLLSTFGPMQTARAPLVQPTAQPAAGLLAFGHAVLLSSTAVRARLRSTAVAINHPSFRARRGRATLGNPLHHMVAADKAGICPSGFKTIAVMNCHRPWRSARVAGAGCATRAGRLISGAREQARPIPRSRTNRLVEARQRFALLPHPRECDSSQATETADSAARAPSSAAPRARGRQPSSRAGSRGQVRPRTTR